MFVRPPHVPPEYRRRPPADFLFGSDVYVVVAGKLFADAAAVEPWTLKIATAGVSTLIYAETRAELVELYAMSMVAGMNYHLAALPQDFKASTDSAAFDPVEMGKMFEEGRRSPGRPGGTARRRSATARALPSGPAPG